MIAESRLEPRIVPGTVESGTDVTVALELAIDAEGTVREAAVLRCDPDREVLREAAIAFGVYTMSLGRPLMFILILIMAPLATTEIGTATAMSGECDAPRYGWLWTMIIDLADSSSARRTTSRG